MKLIQSIFASSIIVGFSTLGCAVAPADGEQGEASAEANSEHVATQEEALGAYNASLTDWFITTNEGTIPTTNANGNTVNINVVRSGTVASLYNAYEKYHLGYGHRDYGINLTWVGTRGSNSAPTSRIRFDLANGAQRPLVYGDKVFIFVERPNEIRNSRTLYYTNRDSGINLGWTANPAGEGNAALWEIVPSPGQEFGKLVDRMKPFGLKNLQIDDTMMGCSRRYGVDLVWSHDCTDIPTRGRIRTADASVIIDGLKKGWKWTKAGWNSLF